MRLERRLLATSPREAARREGKRLDLAQLRLLQRMNGYMKERRHAFELQIRRLDALSPLKVMQRGYSIVYDGERRIVRSVKEVQPGDPLAVRLSDGELDCAVWSVKGERNR